MKEGTIGYQQCGNDISPLNREHVVNGPTTEPMHSMSTPPPPLSGSGGLLLYSLSKPLGMDDIAYPSTHLRLANSLD